VGKVLDITEKLPRSQYGSRVFDPHFVDLRFLRLAVQSLFWEWTGENEKDVPHDTLPEDLRQSIQGLLQRHIAGPVEMTHRKNGKGWAFSFTVTTLVHRYSYTLFIVPRWTRQQ
jgi:hypothetical protein